MQQWFVLSAMDMEESVVSLLYLCHAWLLWLLCFGLQIVLELFFSQLDDEFSNLGTVTEMPSKLLYVNVQFSSFAQSCPTPCDPWITARQASLSITNSRSPPKPMSIESVMPSHPPSSPSPLAPNPSQHQGPFQWVNSSHEVAKVLEFQLQHQFLQWTPRTDLP